MSSKSLLTFVLLRSVPSNVLLSELLSDGIGLGFVPGTGVLARERSGVSARLRGVSGRDIGVLGRDIGVLGRDIGVSGLDIGVSGREIGVSGRDIGVSGLESGVLGQEVGVSGHLVLVRDISTFKGCFNSARDDEEYLEEEAKLSLLISEESSFLFIEEGFDSRFLVRFLDC